MIITSAQVLILTSIAVVGLWLAVIFKSRNKKLFLMAAIVAISWELILLGVGKSAILLNFETFPPPVFFFFPVILGLSFFLSFSKLGAAVIQKVSLANLVLFHSFRIFAELALFLALREGLAPVQLTFEGYNYDIVTGVLALVLGLYLRKNKNECLVWIFNVIGLVFLSIIGFIAITSMPLPIRVFMNEPSNIWVLSAPYILLPGILVLAAFTGHFLIFRKLRQ